MNQDGRQPHILVVDDDHHLCDLLAEILTEAGYAVQCARDGEAAWEEIAGHPPDLILSDITMPRLDGVRLGLRMVETGSRIPLVLMSAGPPDGADVSVAFVPKPFEINTVLERIAHVLNETSTSRVLNRD